MGRVTLQQRLCRSDTVYENQLLLYLWCQQVPWIPWLSLTVWHWAQGSFWSPFSPQKTLMLTSLPHPSVLLEVSFFNLSTSWPRSTRTIHSVDQASCLGPQHPQQARVWTGSFPECSIRTSLVPVARAPLCLTHSVFSLLDRMLLVYSF